MRERVFGLEVEYSLSHMPQPGSPQLPSSEASRYAVKVANEQLRGGGNYADFWSNGGRLYEDLGHIEWATPECRSIRQAVIFDKAGDLLMARTAAATEDFLATHDYPGTIFIAKNNVDAFHNTFGSHENYLVQRKSDMFPDEKDFFRYLVRCLLPFLVSRSIICGSGWLINGKFHISQRASFMECAVSDSTRFRRPIINTREEPHADSTQYRRLHLIMGDANMAEWAIFLKIGTTALVLEMIEDTFLNKCPELSSPVDAMQVISSDPDLTTTVPLQNGQEMTALEIQQYYLESASRYFEDRHNSEAKLVIATWDEVLHTLKAERLFLTGKLDWVTKYTLLQQELKGGLDWNDPRAQVLDQKYHSVRSSDSVFHVLDEAGVIEHIITPQEIEYAVLNPPAFTRARLRVEASKRQATSSNWDSISLAGKAGNVSLPEPLDWCPIQVLHDLGLTEDALCEWLSEGLEASEESVRIQALEGLGQVKSFRGAAMAREVLQNSENSRRVRAAAAKALGALKDRQAIEILQQAAQDSQVLVRLCAMEALGAF